MGSPILNIPSVGFSDDSLEAYVRNDVLYIEITNPWAGDTESGFGYTCALSVNRAGGVSLRDFIQAWLDGQPSDT